MAFRLTPSELLDWAAINGHVVSVDEYAILRDMGTAWADAMNEELRYSRERKAADDEATAASKGKGKKVI